VIEALTGVKPKVYRRSDGDIEIVCGRSIYTASCALKNS
jgi:hypothetical protein